MRIYESYDSWRVVFSSRCVLVSSSVSPTHWFGPCHNKLHGWNGAMAHLNAIQGCTDISFAHSPNLIS